MDREEHTKTHKNYSGSINILNAVWAKWVEAYFAYFKQTERKLISLRNTWRCVT